MPATKTRHTVRVMTDPADSTLMRWECACREHGWWTECRTPAATKLEVARQGRAHKASTEVQS